jgi:hypothetical protein
MTTLREFLTDLQFDILDGERRKEAALAKHEQSTWDLLPRCRAYLAERYRRTGEPQSADDARRWLDQQGIPESQRGARLDWMGALFRGKEWQAVGYVKSTHPANHARRMLLWRLR